MNRLEFFVMGIKGALVAAVAPVARLLPEKKKSVYEDIHERFARATDDVGVIAGPITLYTDAAIPSDAVTQVDRLGRSIQRTIKDDAIWKKGAWEDKRICMAVWVEEVRK